MKRALMIVLLVAVVLTVLSPLAMTAHAGGPWGNGYGYGYVFPGSGYNKVCMYSYWNCSYRFVPPYPVSGYYLSPYNSYSGQNYQYNHYNPNWCPKGLLCAQGGGYGGY